VPIPLSVVVAAIATPIVAMILVLSLNARYQRRHSKEWFGKQGANRLTAIAVSACIVVLIVTAYLISIAGVALD
jgi:hypothetical protein